MMSTVSPLLASQDYRPRVVDCDPNTGLPRDLSVMAAISLRFLVILAQSAGSQGCEMFFQRMEQTIFAPSFKCIRQK